MTLRDINPPNYFLLSIILIIAFHFILPVARLLKFPWNLLGLLSLMAGVYLNLAADQLFKKYRTTVKPLEKSSYLVTTGVFRISRNPMYLGMVLFLVGLTFLLGSLTPWLFVIVFAIFLDRVFINFEEKNLLRTFGEEWSAYRNKVRRWILF